MMVKNFAITGVGGYIAPRHLKAIYDTGNQVIAAVDPKDSVGFLDRYSFDISFFTEFERFDRHLEKLRRGPEEGQVHILSVCAPNYLHDAHCRLALRVGADVICEKPLVINPWNLDALQELEAEFGQRIYTVLQLRLHPRLLELRQRLLQEPSDRQHEVELAYITARGIWYRISWKGDVEKSGGVATNIGIHFFDLLMWLFGEPGEIRVYHSDPQRMSGYLELERAKVKWFLSTDHRDLPYPVEPGVRSTYRSISIDGEEIEFSTGFTDLHTRVYEETLAGRGFGIAEARPSISLVSKIRNAPILPIDEQAHPLLRKRAA
jgi:UDP-N-acetyl-2-amino-2-deoxyglucuronate dehydrogenase